MSSGHTRWIFPPQTRVRPEWWTCVYLCRFQSHSAAVRLDPIKNFSLWIPCQSLEVKSRPDVPVLQHGEHTRCQKGRKKIRRFTFFTSRWQICRLTWSNYCNIVHNKHKTKTRPFRISLSYWNCSSLVQVWGKLGPGGHMCPVNQPGL